MAEPSVTEVFGAGATQSGSSLTILKSDLEAVGLTISADNTAESLFTAVILLAKNRLTQSNFDSGQDQDIIVEPGFTAIIQRDDGNGNFSDYRQDQLVVKLHKPDTGVIDPDDY